MLRAAAVVRMGTEMALGAKPPKGWFEAMSDSAQQAEKVRARDQLERQQAAEPVKTKIREWPEGAPAPEWPTGVPLHGQP